MHSTTTNKETQLRQMRMKKEAKEKLEEGWIRWWPGTGSNRPHEDFQSSALPTELSGQRVPLYWFPNPCQHIYGIFFHFFTGRNAMPMRGQIAPTPATLLYPLFAGFSTRASRLLHVCPSVLACPNSSGTAAFSSAAILTLYPPSPRLSVPSSSPS